MVHKILTQWAYLRNMWFLQTKGETNLWLVKCFYLREFNTTCYNVDDIDEIIKECIVENTKHCTKDNDCGVYLDSTSIAFKDERNFWVNEISRQQKSSEHIDLIIDVLCKATQDNKLEKDKNVQLSIPLFLYSYDKDVDWKFVLPHTQEVHKTITLTDSKLVYQVLNAGLYDVNQLAKIK